MNQPAAKRQASGLACKNQPCTSMQHRTESNSAHNRHAGASNQGGRCSPTACVPIVQQLYFAETSRRQDSGRNMHKTYAISRALARLCAHWLVCMRRCACACAQVCAHV
eukprot:6184821-Pleurochrysis_carterae.AAC.2